MVNSKRTEPEIKPEPKLQFVTLDAKGKRLSFFECSGNMKSIPEVADFVTRHPGVDRVNIYVKM